MWDFIRSRENWFLAALLVLVIAGILILFVDW